MLMVTNVTRTAFMMVASMALMPSGRSVMADIVAVPETSGGLLS